MRHIERFALLALILFVLFATGSLVAQPPRDSRPTLADTSRCLDRAQRETDLVPNQMRRLCIATPNPDGPVQCFLEATQSLMLTDSQSVELCRCSPSPEPARCVRQVRDRSLITEQEMVALCSPTLTLGLRTNCTPYP